MELTVEDAGTPDCYSTLHLTLKEAVEDYDAIEIREPEADQFAVTGTLVTFKNADKGLHRGNDSFGLVEGNYYLPLYAEHDVHLLLCHPAGLEGNRYMGVHPGDRITVKGGLYRSELGEVSLEVWYWEKVADFSQRPS